MAFLIQSTTDGHVPAWEYLPCSAITPKAGMAMIESSGKLAIATGTNAPKYICMREEGAAVTAGDIVPVIRVTPDIVFAVPLSASGTSLKIGDLVTLHASDGLQVTATTTSGVAEIVGFPGGQASGDIAFVRFA